MLLDQHGFPLTRIHEATPDSFVVERIQDVEDIIEANKALQNEPQTRAGTFRHIGQIPLVIYERWYNEEVQRGNVNIELFGEEMEKVVARKLQDPDWRLLICTPGRI